VLGVTGDLYAVKAGRDVPSRFGAGDGAATCSCSVGVPADESIVVRTAEASRPYRPKQKRSGGPSITRVGREANAHATPNQKSVSKGTLVFFAQSGASGGSPGTATKGP